MLNSRIIVLGLFLAVVSCSTKSEKNGSDDSLKGYLHDISPAIGPLHGNNVVFLLPSNTCDLRFEKVKGFLLAVEHPGVKCIYSIEHKGRADIQILAAAKQTNAKFYLDFDNLPYKKGLIKDNLPTVFFLTDGDVLTGTSIISNTFSEIEKEINHFLQRKATTTPL